MNESFQAGRVPALNFLVWFVYVVHDRADGKDGEGTAQSGHRPPMDEEIA